MASSSMPTRIPIQKRRRKPTIKKALYRTPTNFRRQGPDGPAQGHQVVNMNDMVLLASEAATESRQCYIRAHGQRGMPFDLIECPCCIKTVRRFKYSRNRKGAVEFHYAPCGLPCAYGPFIYDAFILAKRRAHTTKGKHGVCEICGPMTPALANAFRQMWKRKEIAEKLHDKEIWED